MRDKFHLLVAEDDTNDRHLLEHLLVGAGLASVSYVTSGTSLLDYLAGRVGYADRSAHPYPDILLLDLALPQASGFEALDLLAGQPERPPVTVYVITGSRRASDRDRAVCAGVAGYFQKPLGQVAWILEDRLAGLV